MSDESPKSSPAGSRPAIIGDVVFGDMTSPVAVCTLASRSMLAKLAGRPEIAVAGRVFTENVGIERMVQNLAAFDSVRFLIVCGRETKHNVGQTILALHRSGLDANARVIGCDAPEPIMPNLTAEQLRAFQDRVVVVDMIEVTDAEAVVERARALSEADVPLEVAAAPSSGGAAEQAVVERISATRDLLDAWIYDPVGYFLVFVDSANRRLRVEQYTPEHRQVRIVEGANAEAICHTIVRLGQVTLLAHAAYLGRELARAETALQLGLTYEQDRMLAGPVPSGADSPAHTPEHRQGGA